VSKPRTFLSSTCYDLVDARAALGSFLRDLGHEVLASESMSFGVAPGKHSHEACLDQVDNANFFILIVGGRRGGSYIGSEKSITNEEYRRAMKRGIPVFIFVKKDVERTGFLYRKNPQGDFSSVVDDVRVFDFIDSIRSASIDNWIKTYDDVTDIIEGIRAQFAYVHLLYSQQCVAERTPRTRDSADKVRRTVPFPTSFEALFRKTPDLSERTSHVAGLHAVHKVIATMRESGVQGLDEKLKTLWIIGRYGEFNGDSLRMSQPSFQQHAWGRQRTQRIFDQLREFAVRAEFETGDAPRGDGQMLWVEIRLSDSAETYALSMYVDDLIQRFGEDEGLERFRQADMRLYSDS
jgi:Domain of unknown function (DUF4062)